ncbi:MAG: hypothetical protein P8Y68_17610 [Anaerolineales bacterium]
MAKSQNSKTSKFQRQESLMAWIFSAPALILLIIFLVVPFVMAIGLSFTDQRLIPNPNLPTKIVSQSQPADKDRMVSELRPLAGR